MKKALQLFFLMALGAALNSAQAQSLEITRYIMPTDTVTDEGVTFEASSDDAEQENESIDALFDDDIDAGWEGAPEDFNVLTAGMRFRDLFIPRGATIDSAFIVVHSHEAKTAADVANLTILADANPNAPTFTEDSLIDARNFTNAQVDWMVAEEWGLWTPERTRDLSSIVQEMVDNDGWKSGNPIAFIVQGQDQGPSEVENAREWESYENIADPEDGGDGQNKPERRPQLFVYYSVASAEVNLQIVATDTITDEGVTFAASSDDAEQENESIDALFDDDIDAGWEGAPEDFNVLTAGMRFQRIPVPQGAVIDSAFIEVVSHEAKTADDVANLTIVGDANPNPPTFTEDSLIDARIFTSAQIEWIVAEEWGLWSTERTPDLKDIVQEIVDTEGWQAGNAMAFIVLGEDQGPSEVENAREWESYENISDPEDGGDGQNKPERRPRLFIYFSNDQVTAVDAAFRPEVKPLTVYPNPTTGDIRVELESDDAALIRIFNTNGQLLREQRSDFGYQHELNVGELTPGMYYIKARQNGKIYLQKLIVE